jgi:hypothetical protein
VIAIQNSALPWFVSGKFFGLVPLVMTHRGPYVEWQPRWQLCKDFSFSELKSIEPNDDFC